MNEEKMHLKPKEELQNLTTLLTLFHHRNKNQHRLVKWYKSLTILHRQVPKLLSCLATYYSALELSEKSRYTVEAREKLKDRVEFLGKWVVGICYLAFSTLVADNQYAALGLLLIGILARLRSVLKALGKELGVEIEMEEIEEAAQVGEKELDFPKIEAGDDFGEVVSRTAIAIEDTVLGKDDQESPVVSKKKEGKKKRKEVDEGQKGKEVTDSTPSKRPKKKRKKGDAFDDLFSGLI